MTELITNYLINLILDKQNVKQFYEVLTRTHYYCEDDFELKTKYSILLFIDTLLLDKYGYKGLKVLHTKQSEIYQYIADNRLKIFHYVTFKASAQNDLEQLNMLVDEFKKDNWIILFGYYTYNKALELLTSKDDCFDIKNKIYAIICSIKAEQAEKAEKEHLTCSSCINECPICLETMNTNSSFTTLCLHSFHKKCLLKIFDEATKKNVIKTNISCPLCRADVLIKSIITFNETTQYCNLIS